MNTDTRPSAARFVAEAAGSNRTNHFGFVQTADWPLVRAYLNHNRSQFFAVPTAAGGGGMALFSDWCPACVSFELVPPEGLYGWLLELFAVTVQGIEASPDYCVGRDAD